MEGIPVKAKITNNLLRRLKATGKGYDVYDTELPGFALRVSPEGKPTSYCVRYNSGSGRKQRLGIGSVKVFTPHRQGILLGRQSSSRERAKTPKR